MCIIVSTFALFALSYTGRFIFDEHFVDNYSWFYYCIILDVVTLLEGGSMGAILWTHFTNFKEDTKVKDGPTIREVILQIGVFQYCLDEELESCLDVQQDRSHEVLTQSRRLLQNR